jgi:uncharacterized protein (TIGR02594 family)
LQIAGTMFTLVKDKVDDLIDKSVTLQVRVVYKTSQLPLAGASVKIKDATGENLIKDNVTNEVGAVVLERSIHYGDYIIEVDVEDKGVSYASTQNRKLDEPFVSLAYAFEESWPRVLKPESAANAEASVSSSSVEPAPVPAVTKGPVWLATAFSELGTKAESDQGINPRILDYWKSIPNFNSSQAPTRFWPSAFAEWVLNQNKITGPRNALSRSWLSWGRPVDPPTPGCVAVFWAITPESGAGFVGFYISSDAERTTVIGGSVPSADGAHSVALVTLPKARFLGCREPA